jgi:hypothetical protein
MPTSEPTDAERRSMSVDQLLKHQRDAYTRAFPPEPGNHGAAFGTAPPRATQAEEHQARVYASARAWRAADREAEDLPERLRADLFRRTAQQFGARPGGTSSTALLVERLGTPPPERRSEAPLDVATARLVMLMTGRDPRDPAA